MKIIKRLKAPTPDFFKKIVKIGIALGTIGGCIIAVPSTYGIAIPAIILTAGKLMAAVGGTAVIVAQSTVKDPDKIK